MECVILFRNPSGKGIGYIGDAGEIAVFKGRDEAIALALNHHLLLRVPHQIVECDEL